MQVGKYDLQWTEENIILRDSHGNFICCFPTEEEALEFIYEEEEKYCLKQQQKEQEEKKNLYQIFITYCKKLPGKCFLDGKLATYNEKALERFIKSFEKNGFKVIHHLEYRGGEYFAIVDDVLY